MVLLRTSGTSKDDKKPKKQLALGSEANVHNAQVASNSAQLQQFSRERWGIN
jgi:hypothetical protein